jgi:Glycosyltransferase 61
MPTCPGKTSSSSARQHAVAAAASNVVILSSSAAAVVGADAVTNGFLPTGQQNNEPKQQQQQQEICIRERRGLRRRRGGGCHVGFTNRGLVIVIFGLSGFLPISQWMRMSSSTVTRTTNHCLSVFDCFNILGSGGDPSSSPTTTTMSDSMAAIAMLGLNNYKSHATATAKDHHATTSSNNLVVGGHKIGEDSATEELLLPATPKIVTASSLLTAASDELCPTTTTMDDDDERHRVVAAVTEADEGGFFIRTSYPQSYPIEDIVIMEGNKQKRKQQQLSDNSTTLVVVAACEFRHNLPNSNHFPHTMQQLYRCWSWWQYQHHAAIQLRTTQAATAAGSNMASSSSSSAATATTLFQPVLVLKRDRVQQRQKNQQEHHHRASSMLDNRFVQGFLDALKTAINLTIVYDDDDDDEVPTSSSSYDFPTMAKPKLESNRDLYDYRMHSIQDGPNLRTAVLKTLTNSTSAATEQTTVCSNRNGGPLFPRITILNRRKTRRILNAQEMQQAILGLRLGGTTQPMVRVEYFEGGRSFAEQVSVLANTDLLISPHGAQLTGLAFLPSPCSAVLEIFPRGYWIPKFFGSLAATSGVHQHACLYLGAGAHHGGDQQHRGVVVNRTHQVQEATQSVRDRFRTRSQNMCLPLNQTLQAIQQMIHSWQQCCDKQVMAHHHQESTTTTWPC